MVHCSTSSLTDASSGVNSKGGRFNTDTFGDITSYCDCLHLVFTKTIKIANPFRPLLNTTELFGGHGYSVWPLISMVGSGSPVVLCCSPHPCCPDRDRNKVNLSVLCVCLQLWFHSNEHVFFFFIVPAPIFK